MRSRGCIRYTIAHPLAWLSPEERQAFINGLVATFDEQHEESDPSIEPEGAFAEATEEADDNRKRTTPKIWNTARLND